MTDLTTPRAAGRPAAAPAPREPLESSARAPAPAVGAVALSRLLALARPTPPQALHLGLDVLEALVAAAAEGPVPDAVDPVVTTDGRVALTAPSPGVRGRPAQQVLTELAATARRPGPAADPVADGLLDDLDLAGAELATDGVAPAVRRLRTAAGALDRARLRAELGALARAAGGTSAGAGGAGALPVRDRVAPARGRARTPDAPPRAGRTGRRIGAWLLSLVVLGAAVVAEVVLLGDTIRTDIDLVLDAGRGGERPAEEQEPDGLPVVPPAPPAAGGVTSVDLRALAPCPTGTPCTVRLLVGLVPSAEPRTVSWTYRVVDRCTGKSATVPGGTVPVPPQADRVAVVGDVPLPALPGVAVVGVTETPAVAASAPVMTGSCRPAGPDA